MKQFESLLWGIIAALGALVVEFIVFISISAYTGQGSEISFFQFFAVPQFIFLFAGIEEFLKYIVISKRIEMLSLEKSYIINSMLVGLGFFGVEFGLIFMSFGLPDWKTLTEIALLHIGTAGLIGYIVAVRNPRKFLTFFYAFLLASAFHATYNLLVLKKEFLQNYLSLALLSLLVLINIINFFRISHKINRDSE